MSRILRATITAGVALTFLVAPTLAGVRVDEPNPHSTTKRHFGFDIGPRVAFSIPTGEANDYDHGIDAALSFTSIQSPHVGAGIDVGYQHWSSPKRGAAVDEILSGLAGTEVRGTNVFIDAAELTIHMRVVPLPDATVIPWAELGAGIARANSAVRLPVHHIVGPGWTLDLLDGHQITTQPVFVVRTGFDVRSRRGQRVGPDLSYRWNFPPGSATPFTAFSIGGHVRFGSD